jgi:hypothetical protein
MYRQLYQLGGSPTGIESLAMDYGRPLQVPQQQPLFTATGNSTSSPISNPVLNYGQTGLGQAGGTPLTRSGYQEGGITMTQFGAPQEEPIFPRLETLSENLGQAEQKLGTPSNNQFGISPMTSAFTGGRMSYANGDVVNIEDQMMQQSQMQQPQTQAPLQGMEGQQPDIKDPQQALDIIIQMLIAQGIPPEQAREIALQMVQAVAEGGMQEMSDERVEARFGGSMRNGREHYGIGSIFKGAAKAVSGVVKGVTNAVSSVVKSPIGKAALTIAAIYATGGGALAGGPGFGTAGTLFGPGGALGGATGIFGAAPIAGTFGPPSAGLLGVGGSFAPFSGSLVSSLLSPSGIIKSLGGNVLGSVAGGLLGGTLAGGMPQQQEGESNVDYQNRVSQYSTQYSPLLNPTVQYPGNPFYPQTQMAANGGRIGYQEGGIGDLIKQTTQQEFFGTPMMAMGGRIGYAMGAEVPVRENQAGIKELDYRDTGGFVPPIGIKERADDIPAMLSNNEFVFTADAVRNAGDGDENLGAKRMYTLMKNLEAGGSV